MKKVIIIYVIMSVSLLGYNYNIAQIYMAHESGVVVTFDTLYGNFGIGTCESQRLTYEFSPPIVPWDYGMSHNHFVLKIDECFFTNDRDYLVHCPSAINIDSLLVKNEVSDSGLITHWCLLVDADSISFMQLLNIRWLDIHGQVRLEYRIENSSINTHQIGLILLIDIHFDCHDYSPDNIVADGIIYNYPYIPYSYLFFEIGPSWHDEQLIALGYVGIEDCTVPDYLVMGQWEGLCSTCWEFDSLFFHLSRIGSGYWNEGVLLKWNAVELPPSNRIDYITYLGWGDLLFTDVGLNFNVFFPRHLSCTEAGISPNPFEISVKVFNNDSLGREYDSVKVCLELPDTDNYILSTDSSHHCASRCQFIESISLTFEEFSVTSWLINITTGYFTEQDTIIASVSTTTLGIAEISDTSLISIDSCDSDIIRGSLNINSFFISTIYPNPFNSTTRINFSLNQESKVNLSIYNILGRKVITIVDKLLEQGNYTILWNGKDEYDRDCPSGVYLHRFTIDDENIIKKMVLIR